MTNPETSSDLVKRLEWVQNWPSDPLTAYVHVEGINRSYTVDHDGPRFYVKTVISPSYDTPDVLGNVADFDEAKALAQADYAARILSAIAATTIERLTAERDDLVAWFDGLTPNEMHASIVKLRERAEAAESLNARQAEALSWAMDEIDVLSNKLNDFAYPQGMAMVGRRDQLDNYRKAVDARRALATESSNG